jgi:hypothetical protein
MPGQDRSPIPGAGPDVIHPGRWEKSGRRSLRLTPLPPSAESANSRSRRPETGRSRRRLGAAWSRDAAVARLAAGRGGAGGAECAGPPLQAQGRYALQATAASGRPGPWSPLRPLGAGYRRQARACPGCARRPPRHGLSPRQSGSAVNIHLTWHTSRRHLPPKMSVAKSPAGEGFSRCSGCDSGSSRSKGSEGSDWKNG